VQNDNHKKKKTRGEKDNHDVQQELLINYFTYCSRVEYIVSMEMKQSKVLLVSFRTVLIMQKAIQNLQQKMLTRVVEN
jgi:hypothetical protein